MMRLSLLFPLFLLASAQVGTYCAANKVCTSNAVCVDTISGRDGKPISGICCGGKCLADRPNADLGQFCNDTDPCGARCISGSNNGHTLSCGPKNICITDVGNHCNCTKNVDCVSGICAAGTCMATPRSLDVGVSCLNASECQSNNCTGGVCEGKPNATICGSTNECATGLACFRSASPTPQCQQPCATNVTNCCPQGSGSLYCASKDATCVQSTGACTTQPGLGGTCGRDLPCKDPNHLCAQTCGAAGCSNPTVCQMQNTIANGNDCDVDEQCMTGSVCSGSNKCSPLPTLGQQCTGQCADATNICRPQCNATACSANSFCQAPHTIASGSPCANDMQCINGLCVANATGSQTVCVGLGSIANGQWCGPANILSPAYPSLCMSYNASNNRQYVYCTYKPGDGFNNVRICIDPRTIPNGQQCTDSAQCVEGLCASKGGNATTICIDTNAIATGNDCQYSQECVSGLCTDASPTNNSKICKAVAAVAENGACVDHRECADYEAKYALCNNNKCVAYLDRSCTSDAQGVDDQCGDAVAPPTTPPGRNRALYCACTGKCTVAPTPARPPASNNNDCKSRQDAWDAFSISGRFTFNELDTLSGANLTAFLDLQCCNQCDNRFITLAVDLGYVVECTAKTATRYVSSCNPAEAPKGFQNCPNYPKLGTPTSGAVTTGLSLGMVAVVAAMSLF